MITLNTISSFNKKFKICIPFLIILICHSYLTPETFIVFLVGCFLFLLYRNRFELTLKPIIGFNILILFLFIGMIIGVLYFSSNGGDFRDYVRDIFYFIGPVIAFYIAYFYSQRDIDVELICNTIIIWGTFGSLITLIGILQNITLLHGIGDVYHWRQIVGNGSYAGTIAMFFILTRPTTKYSYSKLMKLFCFIVCGMIFVLSMSRTCILIFGVLYITEKWKDIKKNKFLGQVFVIIVIAVVGIILLKVAHVQVVDNFIKKMLQTISEIGVVSDWTNPVEVQTNWRGYETHCAIKEWKSFDIFAMLFGQGFGKRIYVGEYAYTLLGQVDAFGNPENTIPVLHNGYSTMLTKLGITGVILYLRFYFCIIKNAIKKLKHNIHYRYEATMQLSIGIALMLITYFLNGLFVAGCHHFILVFLLGYMANRSEIKKEDKMYA